MAYDRGHPFATPLTTTASLRSSNESLASTSMSRRGPPPFSPPRSNPPQTPSSSSARPPSSRRALTAALELAQEAVRIDSSGTEPLAAIAAYGKSVALLNEVMERVMRGEDANRRRSGVRRRSDAAREDEVRRLKSIHDTYADRMQILSLIYNMDSNQSPPDDASPDDSPHGPSTPPAFAHSAGDYERSTGFYSSDRAPAFLVHDEDEDEDGPASAENIGSALEHASNIDYTGRDYLPTVHDYHSSRSYPSAPPSREYTPSPLNELEYDQPTPTEPAQTPISPTSTITPQRVSVIPPPRPPPSGPPPTLPQPPVPSTNAYAHPTYTLPQPPVPQLQSQIRVNGGSISLPSQPKAPLTRAQSAGPGAGSTTAAPRTDPHSPLRRSYVVSHSQGPTQAQAQAQAIQAGGRSRSGSVAGHKRTGSGNERLGTLSEERERERSEGGNQSASSGTESESWTVVGVEAYSHQHPVAEGYRPTSAYRSRVASTARELPPLPADSSPLTPRVPGNASGGGTDVVQRPRGDTESSASSRGSDGPSSAGTVSTVPTAFSVTVDKTGSQVASTQAPTPGMLVSPSTAQGSIALRRKSAQPSIGQAMAFEQALQSPPQPIQQPPVVSLPPPVPPLPVPAPATNTSRLTAGTLPAGTASRLGITSGRLRASSQPGRRPSAPGAEGSGASLVSAARKASASHASRMLFPRGIPSPIPLGVAISAAGMSPPHHSSPSLVVSPVQPRIPTSAPIAKAPASPQRRPFHLMACLYASLTRRSGGYITPRLHVPHEVWSQGGAKLMNLGEKVRVVDVLADHLMSMRGVSDGFFVGRQSAEDWSKRLDEWSKVCEGLVGEYGKKLGVGEGVTGKKGNRVTNMLKGGLDRITNGKNMDSPTAYTDSLKKLFAQAELFDDHIRALHDPSHPVYSRLNGQVRKQIEQRMAHASEFFASVVLTFVVRDLGLLMDKFVKKTERWLEE